LKRVSPDMTDFVFKLVEQGGYWGVAFLMFLETVFPPIPSEVIMPLAGVVAARGQLSLPLVIASGTAGAMAGNILWYIVAKALGLDRFRPLINRYGRWLTIDWAEIERAHRLFDRHGGTIVFIARMLPTVRSLVSVPAGLLRMKFLPFVLWSTLGSLIWTAGLAIAGWVLGHEFSSVENVLGPLSVVVIGGIVLWYFYRVVTWRPAP
jgi:membrane protein DedA with SNARE-associated domain